MSQEQMSVNKPYLEKSISSMEYYIERIDEIQKEIVLTFDEIMNMYISDISKLYESKVDTLTSAFAQTLVDFDDYKKTLQKILNNVLEQDILLSKKVEGNAIDIKLHGEK